MRSGLLGVALVVGLVVGAAPALADTMYWVELEWTSGLLTGQTDIGSGTFDESALTGVGTEYLGPDGAMFGLDGDVTFDIVVGGVAFDETDDVGYPTFPLLVFTNGVLTGGIFTLGTNPELQLGDPGPSAAFSDAAGNLSEGDVTYDLTNPVPEPASLALFGLGALGLGVARRRRRRAAA